MRILSREARTQARTLFVVALVCLISSSVVRAADETTLTKEQIETFLTTAKIVGSKPAGKGITGSWRLTLSDGTTTHDAAFQAINETKPTMQLASGTELGFVDSYRYNIAAFRLAEMLGLDDIVPVYVERKWKGDSGSLSWWLPVKMDEKGACRAEDCRARSRRLEQSDVQSSRVRPVGLRQRPQPHECADH